MNKINFLRAHKNKWDWKKEINADNKLFKIVGIGPKAFKVLWFGPTPGSSKPTWNQCWWNYNCLDDTSRQVVDKMYNILSSEGGDIQTTL